MDRCGKRQQVGESKLDDSKKNQFPTASTPCARQRMMTTALVQMGLISYCYAEGESVRFCGPHRKASLDLCVFKEGKTKKRKSGAAL